MNIGDQVKKQNNVSFYHGVTPQSGVFCGLSMALTNVYNSRIYVPRKNEISKTLVKEGATLGANCTMICRHTIGRFAFVAARTVVTGDVPDFALVAGNQACVKGWMCSCGVQLEIGQASVRCSA